VVIRNRIASFSFCCDPQAGCRDGQAGPAPTLSTHAANGKRPHRHGGGWWAKFVKEKSRLLVSIRPSLVRSAGEATAHDQGMTVILGRGDMAGVLDVDETIAALGDGFRRDQQAAIPGQRVCAPNCQARARRSRCCPA
jgi:hypothetical protein